MEHYTHFNEYIDLSRLKFAIANTYFVSNLFNQGKECNPIALHCLTINSMRIIVINGRTMFKDYTLIVEYNVIYRDSMYIQ